MTSLRVRLAVLVPFLLVVGPLSAGGQSVGACLDDLNVARPAGSEELVDPGSVLPVLLVHGFNSSGESMGALRSRIQGFSLDSSVSVFDYSPWSFEWVTRPEIADRLRDTIICLSDLSAESGGPGRVAVLAHSMGGLAVRQALGGDPEMGDRVATVVTFGTPFAGSLLADDLLISLLEAFAELLEPIPGVDIPDDIDFPARIGIAPGSPELAALPSWPANVSVFNNAGQFVIEKRFFFWTSEDEYGDLVVDQPSATAGQQPLDNLGGSYTSPCRAYLPDDILTGAAGKAVQLAFLAYVIDQDPLFPYCNHFWLTQNQQLVDNALAQLAAASSRGGPLSGELEPADLALTFVTRALSGESVEDLVARQAYTGPEGELGPFDPTPVLASAIALAGAFSEPASVTNDNSIDSSEGIGCTFEGDVHIGCVVNVEDVDGTRGSVHVSITSAGVDGLYIIDPESVGRAFFAAWSNGDQAAMESLSGSDLSNTLGTSTLRIESGPVTCWLLGDGVTIQCDLDAGLDIIGVREIYFVLIREDFTGRYVVDWASQATSQ